MLRLLTPICSLLLAAGLWAEDGTLEGTDGMFNRVDFKPFYLETDVGTSERERKKFAAEYARPVSASMNHFLKAFAMKAKDFDEFARFYGAEQGTFDPLVRVRLWRRFEPFLEDLQTRYETKAIAAAYKGQIWPKDEYGEAAGPGFREIGTYVEGRTKAQILRDLYHEFGHLFLQTFMKYPAEVPSWLEEGCAQLFAYRKGNGTKPEAERLERMAWLYEMVVAEKGSFGAAITWKDLIKVRNMDNLDFTWQNPLRSSQQYIQVWANSEFFIDSRARSAAYLKLLRGMREASEQEFIRLRRAGKEGKALFDSFRYFLYDVQEREFREAYGADMFSVETKWHEWVRDEVEKGYRRNPELRYYRGTWHMERVAALAPDEDTRKAALAKAEEIFTEATEENEKDPSGWVGLARLAMLTGDEASAAHYFSKANELGSDSFEALVYGGEAMIRNGKAADAIKGLEDALEERPAHWDAMVFLGKALVISGEDVPRGIELLRAAFHQRSSRVDIRQWEAKGYYLLGDYDAAFQPFADIFTRSGRKHAMAAACCAIIRSKQMDDEDVERWIGFVEAANPEVASFLRTKLLEEKADVRLAFKPDGTPAIVGLTVSEEDAFTPVVKKTKKRR